ncbi:unnamed protein product [Discosporangium mesarthrocarpum]
MRSLPNFMLVLVTMLGACWLFAPVDAYVLGTVSPRGMTVASRAWARPRMRMAARSGEAKEEWALIFDCDGVILESESLHREAYNAVFREFDVDYNWTPEYYDELQNKIGGGKPKMRYYFGANGWPSSKLGSPPGTESDQTALIDALQDRKTEIYKDFVRGGTAALRPGVQRLIDEAAAIPEVKMSICSASTKESCLFVLDNLLGKENLEKFDLVLAGDDVPKRKPDPMIYNLASSKLEVDPTRCIVIEDSLIGLEAALGAGMRCIITHTDSTRGQDFTGAVGVFSELGDEGSVQVTANELLQFIQNPVSAS